MATLDDRDNVLDDPGELAMFFIRLFERWQEAYVKKGRRGSPPSEAKFWQWLQQSPGTGNTWMGGKRKDMSLKSCLEIAVRLWDLERTGNIVRPGDAEELFKICGYDPVMPIKDSRLRQIVLDYWEYLTEKDREELVDYAQKLALPGETARSFTGGRVVEGSSN